jgi:hypothetical protein
MQYFLYNSYPVSSFIPCYYSPTLLDIGAWGGVVVKVLRY